MSRPHVGIDRGQDPRHVLAMDTPADEMAQLSLNKAADTQTLEEKDAQIAALIKRNNELADLAFATRDPSSSNTTSSSYSRRGSSLSPKWAMSCVLALTVISQCSAIAVPPAMICSNAAPSNYWKVPSEINCTNILPPWSSKTKRVEIDVFRPNTVRYKSQATVCRIVSQKITYSVNFFGARSQSSDLVEKTVTPEECKQMINHKKCAYGDLISVGTVMKTQNKIEIDWPSAPFQCCYNYETTVSNCATFETTVYAYHGSTHIESPIGPLPGCQYEDGACTMESGAAVIWKPEAEESCQFIFVIAMKGTMADKVWLSDSKEFALSFSLSDPTISDCGHSLTVTDQGYAIRIISIKSRPKRSLINSSLSSQVGLATTNQLAAQLLAVEDNMQILSSSSFHHAVLNLCKSVNSFSSSMIAALATEPTLAMRNILARTDIEAKFLGGNIIRTRSCATLSSNMYRLQPFNGTCFSLPSIEVSLPGGNVWSAFLDPITFIITNEASPISCNQELIFEFSINDTVVKFSPLAGTFEIVFPSRITTVNNVLDHHRSQDKPALTLFHNLVITNISEFIPEQQFTELWATVEGNQAVLSSHVLSRGSSSVKANENSSSRLGFTNPFHAVHSLIYQLWVSTCCFLVTIKIVLTAVELYLRYQIPSRFLSAVIPQASIEQPVRTHTLRNKRKNTIPSVELDTTLEPKESPVLKFPMVYNIADRNSVPTTHIQIRVNGISTSALIDTGSSISLAGRQLCPALGIFHLDPPQTDSAMGMAGIHVAMSGSKQVTMQIGDMNLYPTLHFTTGACVPNTYCAYEIILGSDILALLPKMSIDFAQREVTFGDFSIPFGGSAIRKTMAEIPVRASKTMRVPANTETFVPCTVENHSSSGTLVLVSQSTKLANDDLIVAPALISSDSPLLLVSNPTNEHKTIFAGTRLSTAVPADNSDQWDTSPGTPLVCVNEEFPDDPSFAINLEDSDISDEQKQQLRTLLDDFSDVFSRHQYDIGSCTAEKVHIFTTNDPPAKVRPYRIPVKYREELQKHINMLLKTGVLKESNTNWVHNLVVVPKKDNSLRVCLDMRRPINEVT
ncbi:putative ATP synthase F0, A subunit [Ancylostoma ceylanicum]|uniref:Putative ATP synthase F0, A subunit n=1 Tax=Ancylostoma ceylanicum TaxID=53326 RepID=A0A0D6LEE9_9BILA|nr:putative ATP synthase F0, A subunit [Ancylostoma ceylanicum]